MIKNEMIAKGTNELFEKLPPEVIAKYGWIVLALPAVYHTVDKVYDFMMAKIAMENDYTITVDNRSGKTHFDKSIVVG